MKCTIFSVLFEGFKYNANIYNLKKTTSQKMHSHFTSGKTEQNSELPIMDILYIKPLDICSPL